MGSSDEGASPPPKRPRRTYRACYPCRDRKLKCNFGDPNKPSEGACERCQREQRRCLRAPPVAIRGLDDIEVGPQLLEADGDKRTDAAGPSQTARFSNVGAADAEPSSDDGGGDDDRSVLGEGTADDALVSAHLQNPSEALQLIANATLPQRRSSNVGHTGIPIHHRALDQGTSSSNNATLWKSWRPVRDGMVTVHEARSLLSFFELEMAPLYPIVPATFFEPHYLGTAIMKESLLLGVILAISSRYSTTLGIRRGRDVHIKVSGWVRRQVSRVLDGDAALRSISTVEALLLLSEWPMLSQPPEEQVSPHESITSDGILLQPSARYEASAWSNIGIAVRLAQELGLHDLAIKSLEAEHVRLTWEQSRKLKTWVYCYNADRHVSVRLGRNAVLQPYMSSAWWEKISSIIVQDTHQVEPGCRDAFTSEVYVLSLVACLVGTIQEHLYPNPEVTRSLLRTGVWESFLRSLRLEIRFLRGKCHSRLKNNTVDSALLKIELDFVVLYANSLALRALQEKLRRRRRANDLVYEYHSLLNLVEGPWILEALASARSIVDLTLTVLEERGVLRYCPSRVFPQILFATTFMYKALATGVVDHGEQSILNHLDAVVQALKVASIDEDHFPRGFAILLDRLGEHWRTARQTKPMSPSILVRREDNDDEPNQSPVAPVEPEPAALPRNNLPLSTTQFGSLFSPNLVTTAAGASSAPFDPIELPIQPDPTLPFLPNTADGMNWHFDPAFHMPAEQDALLQSIWDGFGSSSDTTNMYATLLGDIGIGAELDGA